MPGPSVLALPWFIPYLILPALSRRRPLLLAEPSMASGPRVSVIVPARNEAGNIDRLLRSLRATSYSPVEIIVVDDRSSDETAARAEAHTRDDARVRLIQGAPLPAGWLGKAWACYQGARAARGELLVFTDADTTHHPELLAHAVGGYTSSGADLLTVVTGQILGTFWERVIMPHILVALGARFHPDRINRATRARDVLANGQFFLTSSTAYHQVGTHEAVKNEVAEDLVMGQRFIQAGLRLRMWWAEELIQTRMYTSLDHLVEGWSKNLYLGSRSSFPDQPVLRAVAPWLVLAGPLFWLVPLMVLLWSASSWAIWAAGLSLGFWLLVMRGSKLPSWYALTYPLGAGMIALIVMRSILRGSRKIEWKGRTYTVEGSRGKSKTVEDG